MTHNHVNYQARLDFVRKILDERFGLAAEIDPIQYDPDCPFKYNNFVYRVSLQSPAASGESTNHAPPQTGTVPIPQGTREFIMRLANPEAEGMHAATRVENEVAIISLAFTALRGFRPHVVPRVYGWGSAKSGQGWILQEFMPGLPVNEAFGTMDHDQKKEIFVQMAELLKALQEYKLPETITDFGGVTYNDDGQIISAIMPTVGTGPWRSFEASFVGRLEVGLKKADKNPYIKGWRTNGLRDRLEAFVAEGVPAQFKTLSSKEDRSIVHADFTLSNVLFDATSGRITALIDYDFATISHPSYEFLRSFDGAGGQFRGWTDDEESEKAALRNAKLHGFPTPLPETTTDGSINWEVSKAWEDALERAGVKRPRNIQGIEGVADVDTILRSILSWRVSNSDILRLQSEEAIVQCRDENEKYLDKLLSRLGW